MKVPQSLKIIGARFCCPLSVQVLAFIIQHIVTLTKYGHGALNIRRS